AANVMSISGTLELNGFSQQVSNITGGGTVTNSGSAATFTINNGLADTFAGLIRGAISLSKTGNGALTLSGTSTYTGSTTISAGSITEAINNAFPIATSLSVGTTLDLKGFNQQVASVTGSGTVTDSGAAATFTVNNSSADTFAGLISGAVALTKSGAGTF